MMLQPRVLLFVLARQHRQRRLEPHSLISKRFMRPMLPRAAARLGSTLGQLQPQQQQQRCTALVLWLAPLWAVLLLPPLGQMV
jgi:hypothetical protein